ncbi:MAG: hypothetical protein NC418_08240 [Muribaculaceae bacterium]|nr:hypothetical protein [Muribaculaceae bacterium]
MKSSVAIWLKVAAIGVVAFLTIFWVAAFVNEANIAWSEMMWAFAATYLCLAKFKDVANYGNILSAVGTGLVILPLIVVCSSYGDSHKSIIFLIAMLLGVLLAGVCHAKKSTLVFVLAVAVMVLFCTFAVPQWFEIMR